MSFIKTFEVNQRARTSAAIIGLAISMGTYSLLLAGQGDEAKAAEPIDAEPTTTTVSKASDNATVVSASTKKEHNAATSSKASTQEASTAAVSTPSATEDRDQLDHTLVHVSKPDRVDGEAIAASNRRKNVATIPSSALQATVLLQAKPVALPSVIPAKSQVPYVPPAASTATLPHAVIDLAKTRVESATPAVTAPQEKAGEVHQVKPGDTLEAIAQAHGVSSDELVVVIPSKAPTLPTQAAVPAKGVTVTNLKSSLPTQPATLSQVAIKGITPPAFLQATDTSKRNLEQPISLSMPAPTLPNDIVIPAGEKESKPSSKKPIAKAAVRSTVAGYAVLSSTASVMDRVGHSSDFKADSLRNHYLEILRDEIVQMRQQYRVHRESDPAGPTLNFPVNSVTLKVPASQYINPEFAPSRYNQALGRENPIPQQKQSVEPAPIIIKVPAPDAPARKKHPSLVAVAPMESDSYNPTIQPSIGQTVAPESLPPGNFNGFMWPTKGVLTSGFGPRWGRMHKGIDIAAPVGTPVVAAATGVVVYARWNTGGYGNLVDIQHPDGSITRYGHNHRILVREGQQVQQGQQIAEMGSTGHSTGPHCHFEVHLQGREAVNPIAYLPRR